MVEPLKCSSQATMHTSIACSTSYAHLPSVAHGARRARRLLPVALYASSAHTGGIGRSAVGQVVDICLDLVSQRKLDSLVDFMSSEELLLDSLLPTGPSHDWADHLPLEDPCSMGESDEPPTGTLQHLLDAMQEHSPALHLMDTCAIRTLVLQRPRLMQKLSGVWLSPHRYVQRVLVEGPTGEEAVLTLTLVKQGGSTTSYSRVASPASWWSLCSLRGEALHAALPTALSPEFGPEAIVKSQLDALRRGDLQQAYALLSPNSQRTLGGLESFMARILSKRSPYCQLLGHSHAASVRRCQSGQDTYLELQMVQGPLGASTPAEDAPVQLWCWVLRLQGQGGEAEVEDCWAIDSVLQVPQEAL